MLNKVYQIIDQIEKRSAERYQALAKSLDEVIRRQNITGQIRFIDQQRQIITHVYQAASSYSNLIIFAGYAGIFAVWQFTRSFLTKEIILLVALLVSISLILFTGYEVYKMISQAFFFRKLDRAIRQNIPEPERISAWQQAWNDYAQRESRIWLFFLVPTLLTGFGAGGLLIYAFVRQLFDICSKAF
jgi:hypothetical protein